MGKRKNNKIKMEDNIMEENNITIETTEEVLETPVEETIEEVLETPVEETTEEVETDDAKEEQYGIVIPNKLNIREDASKESNVLVVLDKDASVKIIDEVNEYYKVETSNGVGYCVKEFIEVK